MTSSISTTRQKIKRLVSIPLGDIHFGTRRVSPEHIAKCMLWAVPDQPSTADIDILYISGDFFDHLLLFNSTSTAVVVNYIRYILTTCKKYDIQLRVLEGTPSHDWKQNSMFVTLNNDDPITGVKGIGCDLEYFTEIKIEYNAKHGIHVLYVPDLKLNPDDMWKTVQSELQKWNIDKVAFTVIHGAFHHQLNDAARRHNPTHDPDLYADITEYHVFSNHIHLPSIYRNIRAGGSLVCLRHGEEHDKGYTKSIISNGKAKAEFIVNPHNVMFKTLDMRHVSREDAFELIDKTIGSYSIEGNIRFLADRGDEIYHLADRLKKLYPNIMFTFDSSTSKKQAEQKDQNVESLGPTKVVLTKDNLKEELFRRVSLLLPDQKDRCEYIIDELVSSSK